ncbi:hypothetical protein Pan97_52270 [Bremerella volcania]|uniref:Uncharacterized protein n=1 Tax=Bremerella volcania TaxID=2527984 RepID=A0A518CFZ8_9BACT|nr:hypothetical protein [Bremerella volcania]QDU78145.1 hypothetical protein Pan97_52270 [Bremerella volcania]
MFAFVLLIGFALIACSTMAVIAFLGDWGLLAKSFRAREKPDGKYFYFQSCGIGMAGYRNMLAVGVTDKGLYLAVFFLFRPMHPPLLIPWSEIKEVHENKFFSWRNYYLSIGYPEWASVTLAENVMNEARQYLGEKVASP